MKSRGIFLLPILFMTTLLSFILLSQIETEIAYVRLLGKVKEKERRLFQMENALYSLLDKKHFKKACQTTCNINYQNENYRYGWEDLGVFHDLHMMVEGRCYETRHRRLMLFNNSDLALQVRVADVAKEIPCEKTNVLIRSHIMNWSLGNVPKVIAGLQK